MSQDNTLKFTTKAFVTKPAPYWEATACSGDEIISLKLSDFSGKYLIFFFYPFNFTFVCPTEILAFQDKIQEIRSLNAEIIGCSVDSAFSHLAWKHTPMEDGGLGNIDYPLLSDVTHSISKDYGVYLREVGTSVRGLFIIDGQSMVRQIIVNDLGIGRNVDEIIRLIQAIKYMDEHNTLCPAIWTPYSNNLPTDKKRLFADFMKSHKHSRSST